ncbi:MAG: ester cyclase [Deltaproteobacteria bacterium]|nr:ester cyclase [Deltaproteobacteria bacterium]
MKAPEAPKKAPTTTAAAPATSARKPPLAELQKKALHAMVAAFNAHDPKGLAAVYAEGALVRSPSNDGFEDERGREPIEKGHAGLFAGAPDVKIATVRALQSGDVVVWEWVVRGSFTTKGDAPAKKPVGFKAASVLWFDEVGLIEADHTYFDRATIAGQLGGATARPVQELPTEDGPWIAPADAAAEARNLALGRALLAALAEHDEKGFLSRIDDKTLRDDLTDPDPKAGGVGTNQQDFRALLKAFPDVAITVDAAFAAGDFVAIESTSTGTHQGPLGPFPATKNKVTLHRLDVMDVRSGKVMGWTSYGNRAELTAQIAPAKKG